MRFEYLSIDNAVAALTKLLSGKEITDHERLTLLRAFAEAAKREGNKHVWHGYLNIIKHYEDIQPDDYQMIDRSIIKNATKIELVKEEN